MMNRPESACWQATGWQRNSIVLPPIDEMIARCTFQQSIGASLESAPAMACTIRLVGEVDHTFSDAGGFATYYPTGLIPIRIAPAGRFAGKHLGKTCGRARPYRFHGYTYFLRDTLRRNRDTWAKLDQRERVRRAAAEWRGLSSREKGAFHEAAAEENRVIAKARGGARPPSQGWGPFVPMVPQAVRAWE
jgi:hypothetical protein